MTNSIEDAMNAASRSLKEIGRNNARAHAATIESPALLKAIHEQGEQQLAVLRNIEQLIEKLVTADAPRQPDRSALAFLDDK